MAEITIRPFEERDYPGALAVGVAVYPDYPYSEVEWRHEDARFDGKRLVMRRLVAELPDGRLAGTAEFHHMASMYHPRKFWIEVFVHPELQGRGIGRRLYNALIGLLNPHDPLVLWVGVRETIEQGIRFVMARGFHEARRAWELRLDVSAFDFGLFEARTAEALKGMGVVTVAEERERDPQWLPKLYDLHLEVQADVPRPDTYTPRSLEEYVQNHLESPDFLPDAHFLMKDGSRYVAESFMLRSQELPDILYQGLTGVRRAYRGKGLALALKVHTIAHAKARGTREIRTWNDSLNEPMLAINRKLGFRPQPAWITFEKRLRE